MMIQNSETLKLSNWDNMKSRRVAKRKGKFILEGGEFMILGNLPGDILGFGGPLNRSGSN